MHSTEPDSPCTLGTPLLALARDAIRHGLVHGRPPALDLDRYQPELTLPRASFVTLKLDGRLRGCIGSLEPCRPLAMDVAHNAYAAAFRDPRFPPVVDGELERLAIRVALLTPPVPLSFASEAELLAQLVPFEDGLILADGGCRGTFCRRSGRPCPSPPSSWSSSS